VDDGVRTPHCAPLQKFLANRILTHCQ
jgi:hypothetical protein